MTWLRLDDQITHHLKFLKAGQSASWLWVCCLAHCQRQLTDGFVAFEAMPLLGAPAWKQDIKRLVAVGLMHESEGGYALHDYLEHNASRADVLAKRSQDAARKGRGFQADSTRNPNGNGADSARIPEPRARVLSDPIRTTPIQTEPESARVPRALTGAGPLGANLSRDHNRCANPCGRVCMTPGKLDEFVRRYGGPTVEAERYVRAWKRRVDDAWDQETGPRGRDPVEPKPWDFWDARWLEDHPAAAKKSARELREEAVFRQLTGEAS